MIEETQIGERMRAMARSEGHRRRFPTTKQQGGLAENELSRRDRMVEVLSAGSKTRQDVAGEMGISYASARDYISRWVASGLVERVGEGVAVERFKLAQDAPQ